MNLYKRAGVVLFNDYRKGGNLFKDRVDSGRQLADKLAPIAKERIVLAIPRGGVVVGYEVARRLGYLMDLIIPAK